jgi:uncharacterized protein
VVPPFSKGWYDDPGRDAVTFVTSAFWRRLDLPGHDVCRLEQRQDGWRLDGVAVFGSRTGPVSIAYSVDADAGWKTVSGSVQGMIGMRRIDHRITRGPTGWVLNGEIVRGLDHLVDLDLGFTPATNLLQLRRLDIPIGTAAEVPVVWFDLDTEGLTELPQRYERRDAAAYHYEATSVGYRGVLELDPNGFIRRYPSLWEMA